MSGKMPPRGWLAGRAYLERGRPVEVLASWRTGSRCPRNVMIRREGGTVTARPFRGLRKPPESGR